MQFKEIGNPEGKTLVLLPGTACTWQINYKNVIRELAQTYHLICVNYDGFEGDASVMFTDMITVTKKIERYIIKHHNGAVDGIYGSSLGGSFVGLLIQRGKIHMDHGFIGSSDLDQGGKLVGKIVTKYITSLISGAINNPRKEEKLKNMLQNSLGMELKDESETLLKEYLDNIRSLHPQTVTRQFYSDYVTPLEKDIYREGTKVHIMYALKMGPKYQKRYEKHFRNPDIRCFDMNHEAWMYDKKWVIPVLETIEQCMIQ